VIDCLKNQGKSVTDLIGCGFTVAYNWVVHLELDIGSFNHVGISIGKLSAMLLAVDCISDGRLLRVEAVALGQ